MPFIRIFLFQVLGLLFHQQQKKKSALLLFICTLVVHKYFQDFFGAMPFGKPNKSKKLLFPIIKILFIPFSLVPKGSELGISIIYIFFLSKQGYNYNFTVFK